MSTAKPYNHIKFLKKALVQTILFSLLLFGVNGKAQVGVGIILGSENIRYQKHHSMHAWFTGAELTAQARVVSGRLLIQQSIPATKEFEGQYRTGRVVGGFYDNAIGVYKITEKQTFIGAGIGFTFRGSTDMTRPYFSLDMGSFFSTTNIEGPASEQIVFGNHTAVHSGITKMKGFYARLNGGFQFQLKNNWCLTTEASYAGSTGYNLFFEAFQVSVGGRYYFR